MKWSLFFFGPLLPLIWFDLNQNFMPKLQQQQKNKKNFFFSKEKTSAKCVKKKVGSPLPFPRKICEYILSYLGYFWVGNRACSQVRGSETKFDIFYFTHMVLEILSYCNKVLVSALSNFMAIGFKGHFLKIFIQIFKFGCFSQYHAHSFYKNNFDFLMQSLMLN